MTDSCGTITGIRLAARRRTLTALVPGYLTIEVEEQHGHARVGGHSVVAEDLALLLSDLGLSHRPCLFVSPGSHHPLHPLYPLAERLHVLLRQPVLTADSADDGKVPLAQPIQPEAIEPRIAEAASIVAAALAAVRDLSWLRALGQGAAHELSETLSGHAGLVAALNTRWVASVLADADMMGRPWHCERNAAWHAASARVLAACRVLADRTPSADWRGGPPDREVAATAGYIARTLQTDAALRSREHGAAVAVHRAELMADPGIQREITLIRRRLARARRVAGQQPASAQPDLDLDEAADLVASRIAGEIRADRWPALSARLGLIATAMPRAGEAVAVRAVADAVRERWPGDFGTASRRHR